MQNRVERYGREESPKGREQARANAPRLECRAGEHARRRRDGHCERSGVRSVERCESQRQRVESDGSARDEAIALGVIVAREEIEADRIACPSIERTARSKVTK